MRIRTPSFVNQWQLLGLRWRKSFIFKPFHNCCLSRKKSNWKVSACYLALLSLGNILVNGLTVKSKNKSFQTCTLFALVQNRVLKVTILHVLGSVCFYKA